MGGQGRRTILVIEHEDDSRALLERALLRDYEILFAADPNALREQLGERSIDVVLAASVPSATGVELLEAVQAIAPHTARVLVTAIGDTALLGVAIERARIRHFIRKPLSVRQVREVVRAVAPVRDREVPQIVVCAPEAVVRADVSAAIDECGYETIGVASAGEALEALADPDPDALVVDLTIGTEATTQLLGATLRQTPPVPLLVVADAPHRDEALALVRLGAHDVVLRPFRSDEMALRLGRAIESRRMYSEVIELRRSTRERYAYHDLVGGSTRMRDLYDLIDRVGDTETTVLILGETGTGKELVARILHRVSRRVDAPFVAVNCAAIPDTLIESELFGHEKGAFTGALVRHTGKFEMASGGTLFLDEIGDLPHTVQGKLLRVLQEREIVRVGGERPIHVDCRLIAATHVDLDEAVRAGRFRQDLFYRLNVLPIHIPALRERREDIPLLAGHFLEQFQKRMGKHGITLSRDVVVTLESYDWPGNVRELANVIERLVALTPSDSTISGVDLGPGPARLRTKRPSQSRRAGIRDAVEDLERKLIVDALKEQRGNQTRAARQLGVTRQALAHKLAKYKIRPEDFET